MEITVEVPHAGFGFIVVGDYEPAEMSTHTDPGCSSSIALTKVTLFNDTEQVDMLDLLNQDTIEALENKALSMFEDGFEEEYEDEEIDDA